MADRPRKKIRSPETTIHDVAHRAGVSISTVSLALRGAAKVAEATRQKVLRAAEELRYTPNMAAQSLAARRSNLIAVWGWFGPDSLDSNYYASPQMLMGILSRLKGTRYGVFLSDWWENRHLLDSLVDQRFICGSIWLSSSLHTKFRRLAKTAEFPVTLVESQMKGYDSVYMDNVKAGREAARYLLKHCGRFAVVTADPKGLSQGQRLQGIKAALHEADIAWSKVSLLRAPLYSYRNGQKLAPELAKAAKASRGGCLGVISIAGDRVALGILDGLRKQGVALPQQARVIGWDGRSEGQFTRPSLTTVTQPFVEMGFQAADCLIRRIESPDDPVQVIRFEPSIRAGESA